MAHSLAPSVSPYQGTQMLYRCYQLCWVWCLSFPNGVHQVAPMSHLWICTKHHLDWYIFTTWGHLRITWHFFFFLFYVVFFFFFLFLLSKSQNQRNYFPLHLSESVVFFSRFWRLRNVHDNSPPPHVWPHTVCFSGFCSHKALIGELHPLFSWAPHLGVLCTKNFYTCQNCIYANFHLHYHLTRKQNAFSQSFSLILLVSKAQCWMKRVGVSC